MFSKSQMIRIAVLLFSLLLGSLIKPLRADEGMWLPVLLKQLNEPRMQAMGLKLKAEDIYSINKSSLKDAVVQFGRGCTGEIVSNQGLLITNHHCGYGQIQQHSSLENDYLKKGFWAKSHQEELPNAGLTVTFIIRMEDVSKQIMEGFDTVLTEASREQLVASRSLDLVRQAIDGTHYEAVVRPMYQGNAYYLFVMEVFRDIRLVGAPPASVGNYGGDTDNWSWPRHTGDFSVFRIYAGKDNKPADYSKDNVPFKPRHFFPVNTSGLKENDFTMVYGFPGRTNEYLSSYAVEQIVKHDNPLKVSLRAKRLEVMKPSMDANREVFIKYASKYSSVSNYHKKWAGETKGLLAADAIGKKQQFEAEFIRRIGADARFKTFDALLPKIKALHDTLSRFQPEADLMTEGVLTVEVIKLAQNLKELIEMKGAVFAEKMKTEQAQGWIKLLSSFKKDYYAPIDRQIMKNMLEVYMRQSVVKALPENLKQISGNTDAIHISAVVDYMFETSILDNPEVLLGAIAMADSTLPGRLQTDPLVQCALFYNDYYRRVPGKEVQRLQTALAGLGRQYIEAQRLVFTERPFYPDANFTLRLAYGKAEGYSPSATVHYPWYTDAEGILEKYAGGNPDYELDSILAVKIRSKDFGAYADKSGKLRTCFIASNHTTGGNSGSPVLNGKGELVGVNFDRNWEGTMSDIFYDINQVRNISVDIRYVLFLIDKVAGAGHLVREMKLVR
jgi:hypothetical protein